MPVEKLVTAGTNDTAPADDFIAVTPSDSTDLAFVARAIYVGGTGNLTVISPTGQSTLFANIAEGMIHPIRCNRIMATGTTATGLVAIW